VAMLALSWLLVWACISKGVASSGKVVAFTALFPYVVLFLLLGRGIFLEGAGAGIQYYLTPQWEKLLDIHVWVAAANQLFFSLALGFGGMLTFASYNDPSQNYLRDAVIVPLINCGTSILAGFVVFATLGHISHVTGLRIEDVVDQGPGLAFVVYPQAISSFGDASWVFALLFFFMLLCLALDSAFGVAETSLGAITDARLAWLKDLKVETRAALYCFVCFLGGLLFVTQGGKEWLTLVDDYATLFTLFIVAFLQCIGATWVYGDARLAAATGLPRLLLYHIKYVLPPLLLALLVFSFIPKNALSAQEDEDLEDGALPGWALAVAYTLAAASAIPIVVGLFTGLLPRRARVSTSWS